MLNQIKALVVTLVILITGCKFSEGTTDQNSPPQGEITPEFQSQVKNDLIKVPLSQEVFLSKNVDESWEHTKISNGIMPGHLKLMAPAGGNCVRYLYINIGNAYRIKKSHRAGII